MKNLKIYFKFIVNINKKIDNLLIFVVIKYIYIILNSNFIKYTLFIFLVIKKYTYICAYL